MSVCVYTLPLQLNCIKTVTSLQKLQDLEGTLTIVIQQAFFPLAQMNEWQSILNLSVCDIH